MFHIDEHGFEKFYGFETSDKDTLRSASHGKYARHNRPAQIKIKFVPQALVWIPKHKLSSESVQMQCAEEKNTTPLLSIHPLHFVRKAMKLQTTSSSPQTLHSQVSCVLSIYTQIFNTNLILCYIHNIPAVIKDTDVRQLPSVTTPLALSAHHSVSLTSSSQARVLQNLNFRYLKY
jgi:hypothetical protein